MTEYFLEKKSSVWVHTSLKKNSQYNIKKKIIYLLYLPTSKMCVHTYSSRVYNKRVIKRI